MKSFTGHEWLRSGIGRSGNGEIQMKISMETLGDRDLEQFLKGFEDQLPFATAMGLTRTAKDVQAAEKGHLRGVLHRPLARTVNSIRVKPATKADLSAYIWITDEAHKGTPPLAYLRAQVAGGQRRPKRFENALRMAGILPAGSYVVPGKDAPLNAAGNLSAGTYNKILTALRASSDPMQNRTDSRRSQRKAAAANYFVMKSAGQPLGIYQRTNRSTIKSILHFVTKAPAYAQRIHFSEVADKVVGRRGMQHMLDAITHAIRTSRRRSGGQGRGR